MSEKIATMTDEEFDDRMWEILEMAHKAEAERRGASFTFYCQSEAVVGTRIFSHTNRGRFWTGINPDSREVHHLWLPYDPPDEDQDQAEFERWFNLIHPGALQSAKRGLLQ
jgi:hypothetical protein